MSPALFQTYTATLKNFLFFKLKWQKCTPIFFGPEVKTNKFPDKIVKFHTNTHTIFIPEWLKNLSYTPQIFFISSPFGRGAGVLNSEGGFLLF